jgi:hypothetical protein
MTGSGRVRAFVSCIGRFLARTLGSRGCNAFLFLVDFAVHAWQEAQVLSSLLARLDGSEREQESRHFQVHDKQYLEDITDVCKE